MTNSCKGALLVLLMLVTSGFFGTRVMGQLAMTRSVFTGTYTPITTGGGATLTTIAGDDGTQTLIPIGFTFNYLGTNYTTIDACSNGWISFAASGANAWTNSGLWSNTTPNNTLAPWWDDLNVGTGSVLYQTQGVAGSQTFTVQWTDVLTYNGSGTGRTIHFQVILYEGTNVIEFRYNPAALAGTLNTSESASIGIENGTGGPGNFLDAVSGSAFINQSFMTTHKWPVAFIRFTPGAPTALPGATYTVGLAGTFPNLSEAIANVNHRGIAGPITLSLLDANYDTTLAGGYNIFPLMLGPVAGNSSTNTVTIQPASGTSTLTYRGSVSGNGGNQANSTAFSTSNEPILAVVGTDYVTIRNLNLVGTGSTASQLVDRGLMVSNATATDGSQNCLFENLSVSLIRNNTSGIGIQQSTLSTATSAAGANSNNIYRNLSITNVYAGMYLLGTAGFPDLSCQIGNSSPTAFNTIGSATSMDIGGGISATQNYGIRISSQSSAKVFNNNVQNVAAQTTTDGILCEVGQGTCEIYNNKISAVRNNGTGSTAFACGIRANLATTGTHSLRVYNNFVTNINSAYTGAATATRIVKGIYAQSAGGGVATETINIDANNVYLDGTSFANASNASYEIGTAAGPVINTRNNVFTNFTGAQAGAANHSAWYSSSATTVGNTGSASNYNDLYVNNTTNGFTGIGAGTTYANLAAWQAAMTGQDVNSVAADPVYISSSDLHVTASAINDIGNLTGSAWVTTDIDNAARSGTPDIGADEFTPSTIDMAGVSLTSPTSPGCYTSTEPVSVTIKNNAPSTIDFSVNPVTVTVNVTGAITTTLTVTVNSGTLASSATQVVAMGTINMSGLGTYTFNGGVSVGGDGIAANDNFPTANVTISAGTVTVSPNTVCAGSSTTCTVVGYNGTIQWQGSTDGGATWVNETGPGSTGTPYTATPSDTTIYRVLLCGVHISTTDTVIWNPVITPSVTNDTVCGQDTVHLAASGAPTLNWYTVPSGGAPVATGPTYSPFLTTTTTYYVEAVNGGTVASVGLFDNSAGGAQQSSTNYQIFDVLSNCTLVGVYVYPGAAGTAKLEWRTSGGVLLQASTLTVTAGDVGTRMFFPLGWNLTPGTAYRLQQDVSGVSMFRVSTGTLPYPYTLPGVISITGSAAGATFWYWGFDWQILTGCPGPRVACTGVVNPADSIVATPGGATLCAGDSIAINVTSLDSTYNYLWVPSAGISDSTSASVFAYPTTGTTYIVYAESPFNGCKTTDTLTIDVNQLPVGVLTPTDTLICIGDTSMLSFTYIPVVSVTDTNDVSVPDATPGGASSFITIAGGPTSITPTSIVSVCFDMTHTWDGDMSFTLISPTGTSIDLCSGNGGSADNFFGTCFTSTAVTNITAGAAPFTGDWIPEAGGFGAYTGENSNGIWELHMVDGAGGDLGLLLNWSITLNNGPASWTWSSNPPGFTSTADTVWVSPDTTTIYTVTLQDSTTGCTQDYSWTLNVNPPLTVDILPANPAVCPGDSIALVAVASGGDGAINYNWITSGVLFSVFTVTPASDETHIVMITDGCTTPAVYDTVFVDVTDSLAFTVTADTTICEGQSVTLTANVTVGSGSYFYTWSTGDTTASITVTPGGTTTYTVNITDNCGNSGTGSVTVTVIPLPVASFTYLPASPEAGMPVDFTSTSTGATTYAWDFGGLGTSSIANPTFTFPTDGSVDVTLIVTNSCGSDTSTQSISILVGGSEPLASGSAVVYPNPNTGSFSLGLSGLDGGQVDVRVTNMVGQTIWTGQAAVQGSNMTMPVSLSAPSGVYLLEVRSGDSVARFNVTVQQ